MLAHRLDAAGVQLFLELLGRDLVSAGQFGVSNAETFNFIERPRHILVELLRKL